MKLPIIREIRVQTWCLHSTKLVSDRPGAVHNALPLRSSPRIVSFEQAARAFVLLASDPPADGQRFAEDLYRSVLRLGSSVSALPDVTPGDGPDDIGLDVDDDEWQRVYQCASRLPGEPYYDFVWPDGDQTLADIADDIADIYRDLKPGLDAWDLQKDELVAGTVWLWKYTHDLHWGLHLSGLQKALRPAVHKRGWTGVPLARGEDVFIKDIIARRPQWSTNITRTPNESKDTWTACAEVPSPTGDDSRQLVLWLEGSDPSIGFGSGWHMHAQDMEEFWAHVEAILNDQLVIAVDIGGEYDGFEDVVDLRQPDALLDRVTHKHSAPRTRIKSFAGTQDRELPEA